MIIDREISTAIILILIITTIGTGGWTKTLEGWFNLDHFNILDLYNLDHLNTFKSLQLRLWWNKEVQVKEPDWTMVKSEGPSSRYIEKSKWLIVHNICLWIMNKENI